MELKPTCLVIADISGYTRFVMLHTTSLLHAETIITELMEAVIAQAEVPLAISKLEGDAVFLYAVLEGDPASGAKSILRQVTGLFEAFRARERSLIACNVCGCPACRSIGKLKLKVVVHWGEVAFKQVRTFLELAGENVILIHRLLKNSITSKEYLLVTREFHSLAGGPDGWGEPELRTEKADGIGAVSVAVYYPRAAADLPQPPPPGVPKPGTASAVLYERMNEHAEKRLRGTEERRGFSSLPDTRLTIVNRMSYAFGRVIPVVISRVQRMFSRAR